MSLFPMADLWRDRGSQQGDAVSALAHFTQTVRDPEARREDKALALRFITHIVGDVHQPLQAGNGTDRVANDIDVRWFGEATNLHSVWESRVIEGQRLSCTEYTTWLGRRIERAHTIAWWEPDPKVWIAESAQLRGIIYPASSPGSADLGYSYQYQHLATA